MPIPVQVKGKPKQKNPQHSRSNLIFAHVLLTAKLENRQHALTASLRSCDVKN